MLTIVCLHPGGCPRLTYAALLQVLELVSSRDAGAVYTAGALPCCLNFIVTAKEFIFKDALASAMTVVSRCCG